MGVAINPMGAAEKAKHFFLPASSKDYREMIDKITWIISIVHPEHRLLIFDFNIVINPRALSANAFASILFVPDRLRWVILCDHPRHHIHDGCARR